MSRPRDFNILTSPLAASCLCALIIGLWAAMMLAPALLIARLRQPAIVVAPASAEDGR